MQSLRALVKAKSRGAIRHSMKPSIRPLCSTCVRQNRAPKAPSTRQQLRAPGTQIRPKTAQRQEWTEALSEHLKPTLAHFKSAKKARALNIEPEDAIRLLRSYCDAKVEPGWEARFCREHNIDPPALNMVGMILGKSPAQPLRRMGENMLVCAAMLGDLNSIIHILGKALRTDELRRPELLVPMTKLQFYASKGNADAMVLYGRILDQQKKHGEAAEMFQRVAETPRDAAIDGAIGYSLVQQGNICFRDGKKDEAKAHFKKAAIEFDNPEGNYKLALLLPDQDPLKQTYMLKAAASGVSEAVAEVAALYTKTADLHPTSQEGREAMTLAKHWLELASYNGPSKSESTTKSS